LFLSGVEVGFEAPAGVRAVTRSLLVAEGIVLAPDAAASEKVCVEVFDVPLEL
jgi:hypothetical protein